MKRNKENLIMRNPNSPILFVDDDPLTHKIMKKHLAEWDITYVQSGEEALACFKKKRYLIVIADLVMPDMNGIELMRKIKGEYGVTQVIIVTASEQITDIMRCLEAGVNDFFLKPLKKKEIEEVLEDTVKRIFRWQLSMGQLLSRKRKSLVCEKEEQ